MLYCRPFSHDLGWIGLVPNTGPGRWMLQPEPILLVVHPASRKLQRMGIVYEMNNELGTTFVVRLGVVTAAECLAHACALTSDPGWPTPERRQISDWRSGSLDVSINQAIMEEAAAIYGAHQDKLARLRVAVLAHDEFDQAAAYGRLMGRYGASVIVFNTTITACTWLGVDVGEVNAVLQRMQATQYLVPE
jgi:hypothetical protein